MKKITWSKMSDNQYYGHIGLFILFTLERWLGEFYLFLPPNLKRYKFSTKKQAQDKAELLVEKLRKELNK